MDTDPKLTQGGRPQELQPVPLETKQADLEAEKLRLEIRELNRPWWQRPTYLQALLPVILVLVTSVGALTLAWTRGFFDGERAKLQEEKRSLQIGVESARKQIQELAHQTEALKQLNDNTEQYAEALLKGLTATQQTLHSREIVEDQLRSLAKRLLEGRREDLRKRQEMERLLERARMQAQ